MHTDDAYPHKLHKLIIPLFLVMMGLVSACMDRISPVTPEPVTLTPGVSRTPTEIPTATPSPLPSPTSTATPEPCAPAKYGPLADVDPRGQTVVWWHAYSRDREEMLNGMVETFNATNMCSITIELKRQDSYSVIREKMQADLLIFHPPHLLLGDQRDEALYALQGRIID